MTRQLLSALMILMLVLGRLGVTSAAQSVDGVSKKTMVLMVDTSGSMKKVKDEVRVSLRAFVDGLQPGWQILLVRFDVFSAFLGSVDITGQPEREQLKQWLATLQFAGHNTNFDEGFKGAQAALFQ